MCALFAQEAQRKRWLLSGGAGRWDALTDDQRDERQAAIASKAGGFGPGLGQAAGAKLVHVDTMIRNAEQCSQHVLPLPPPAPALRAANLVSALSLVASL